MRFPGHDPQVFAFGYISVALGAVVAAIVPAARAATLHCGMVLGEQAVLDRDLKCDGPALIVRNPRSPHLTPAYSGGGGRVTCTNPNSLWGLILEVTCCLN